MRLTTSYLGDSSPSRLSCVSAPRASPDTRLAGERQADDHHAVAHEHRLEELDDLGDVRRHRLQLRLEGQLNSIAFCSVP